MVSRDSKLYSFIMKGDKLRQDKVYWLEEQPFENPCPTLIKNSKDHYLCVFTGSVKSNN